MNGLKKQCTDIIRGMPHVVVLLTSTSLFVPIPNNILMQSFHQKYAQLAALFLIYNSHSVVLEYS